MKITLAEGVYRLSGQPMSPEIGELAVHVRCAGVSDGIVVSQHGKHKLTAEHMAQQVSQVLHCCQLLLRRQPRRMCQTVSVTHKLFTKLTLDIWKIV